MALTLVINANSGPLGGAPIPTNSHLLGMNRNHVDNSHNWRTGNKWRDAVLAKAGALKPNWGGGKLLYRLGHGPTDGRFDNNYSPGYDFTKKFNITGDYPYDDIRFGLREGYEMAGADAEFMMVANYGTGTAALAGQMAAYCNATENAHRHTYDKKRSFEEGHPNKGRWNVKRWEIGNEIPWRAVRGWEYHAYDVDVYAKRAATFAKAIKDASDADIRAAVKTGFVCSVNANLRGEGFSDAPAGDKYYGRVGTWYNNDPQEMAKRLIQGSVAGGAQQLDAFIYHGYAGWPVADKRWPIESLLAMFTYQEHRLDAFRTAIGLYSAHPVEFWDTEGFGHYYDERDQAFAGIMFQIGRHMHSVRQGSPVTVTFCMWHYEGWEAINPRQVNGVWVNDGLKQQDLGDNQYFFNADPNNETGWYKWSKVWAQNWGAETVMASLGGVTTRRIAGTKDRNGKVNVYVDSPVAVTCGSKTATHLYVMLLNQTTDLDQQIVIDQAGVDGFALDTTKPITVHRIKCTESNPYGVSSSKDHEGEPGNWRNHLLSSSQVNAAGGVYTVDLGRMSAVLLVIPGATAAAPAPLPVPALTGTDPASGLPGDGVYVSGTNLPTSTAAHEATVGGVPARVTAAAVDHFVLEVPEGAQTGRIATVIDGVKYQTPADFTVLQRPEPVIADFTPTTAYPGDLVWINGEHFGDDLDAVFVNFFGIPAELLLCSDNQLLVIVPDDAETGTIEVHTGWGSAISGLEFTVKPMFPPGTDGGEGSGSGGSTGTEPFRPVLGAPGSRLFIDSTPIDGGEPYLADWQGIDWGEGGPRDVSHVDTAGGTYTVLPMETAMGERRGRLAFYAHTDDEHHKTTVLSQMTAIAAGRRRLHLGSRHLDVWLTKPREVANESRRSSRIAGIEAEWTALDPRWRLNQPLGGIDAPINPGAEYGLYDDQAVPDVVPLFRFQTNQFVLSNWGTAWTYGAGTVVGAPTNALLYLSSDKSDLRAAIRTDPTGKATFTEADELYLAPGDNVIRLETEDGRLVPVSAGLAVSFAKTYMRFQ